MNYEPNKVNWDIGDVVIHDADAKSDRMLMRVIETDRPDGRIGTIYMNRGGNVKKYLNRKEVLHDPMRFNVPKRCVKLGEQLTAIKCFGGGSITIHISEGGLPVLRVHDMIQGDLAVVELQDSTEVKVLVDALNEFYTAPEEKA